MPQLDDATPLILVTNDDGISSPGLTAAVAAVASLGQVIVAAPTTQQTARGRSLVGNGSDFFHPAELTLNGEAPPAIVGAWHLDASPALVVRHALAVLCDRRVPDLVVSGINYGENLGNNITISGTVGAAFQAAAQGAPALAVSRQTPIEDHFAHSELDWSAARHVTAEWARRLLDATFRGAYRPLDGRPPRDGSNTHPAGRLPFDVLKLDVPETCTADTEQRITRLSQRHYFLSIIPYATPETPINASQTSIDIDSGGLDPEDDIYAVAVDRVVSVTPLQLDLTASLDAARRLFTPEYDETSG